MYLGVLYSQIYFLYVLCNRETEEKKMISEAQKIAKLKARQMFLVNFEIWCHDRLDNISSVVIAFTMQDAHRQMLKSAKFFADSGDYKVIKITETNENEVCN